MKNLVFIIMLVIALLAGSLLLGSCTAEVPKTVTLDNTVTTTVQGQTTTTVTTTVITPVFNREPPEIPHTYLINFTDRPYFGGDIPICFECHPIPPFHLDWLQDVDLCNAAGCHQVSDDPILFQ
jgi:hypothetical protein